MKVLLIPGFLLFLAACGTDKNERRISGAAPLPATKSADAEAEKPRDKALSPSDASVMIEHGAAVKAELEVEFGVSFSASFAFEMELEIGKALAAGKTSGGGSLSINQQIALKQQIGFVAHAARAGNAVGTAASWNKLMASIGGKASSSILANALIEAVISEDLSSLNQATQAIVGAI